MKDMEGVLFPGGGVEGQLLVSHKSSCGKLPETLLRKFKFPQGQV